MNSLGFVNFRKFEEFFPLELGDINILVGENNSGKSTFTKAALLLATFLDVRNGGLFDKLDTTTISTKDFSFSDDRYKHIYIDSFYQALYSSCQEGMIAFTADIDDKYNVAIWLGIPSAFLEFVKEHHQEFEVESRDLDYETIMNCYYPKIREMYPDVYKEELSRNSVCVFRVEILDRSNGIIFNLDNEHLTVSLTVNDDSGKKHTYSYSFSEIEGKGDNYQIENLLSSFNSAVNGTGKVLGSDFGSNDDLNFFKEHSTPEVAKESYAGLIQVLQDVRFEYIYAHSVHQRPYYLYDTSVNNDYVDQTISKFYEIQMSRVSEVKDSSREFVKRWMNEFGIGEDFEINEQSCSDTAKKKLGVKLISDGMAQDLSSKGIGAIQLFTLLLRIASLIGDGAKHKTVIIEEPEQNLHPALQSRLTDLFLDVTKNYGCQLIVETHSEYLVRRSQLLVSDLKSENPFNVYYFPSDGMPYSMRYNEYGMFEGRQFGSGFFDEASNMHLQLLRKKISLIK